MREVVCETSCLGKGNFGWDRNGMKTVFALGAEVRWTPE